MCKSVRFATALAVMLSSAVTSGAEKGVSTRPAEPAVWKNQWLRVVYFPETGRLQLTAAGNKESLALCIFPTAIEADPAALPVPAGIPRLERIEGASEDETWRFTASGSSPEGATMYFYQSEFDLRLDRHWVRRRCRVRIGGTGDHAVLLKQVVLDEMDVGGLDAEQPSEGWQSYPIVARSFFWGVDFPVAHAEVKGRLGRLSYRPGVHLEPGLTYETWPVVYGVSPPGRARESFDAYIDSLRPPSPPIHIQYNSWWSLPFPYTESMMLELIGVLDDRFHRSCGGRLDSFCLDLGWSDRQSIWRINKKSFPEGFAPLSQALRRMDSALGLWVSPSSGYPDAQDLEWARANGYETLPYGAQRAACLAGPRYHEAIRTSLVQIAREYNIAHFKFDGYVPSCSEKDHGHEPGDLSTEQIALGLIDVFRGLRAANPQVWIETTCFGYRPSPWWLTYVNTVIGTYGDDAPAGRTPCPTYRESYTTARDFFNLQGARDVMVPIHAQEVLGVVHQSAEPLQNDAMVTALRGHAFLPLYVNPKHMDGRRWRFLARWSQWVRANADLLSHTRAIYTGLWKATEVARDWKGPVGRDPYGYAHFDRGRALILLRNPWIQPQQVELTLDDSLGCPPTLRKTTATVLYPVYGTMAGTYSAGQKLAVWLAPYETRVIALGKKTPAPELPKNLAALAVSRLRTSQTREHEVLATFRITGDAPSRELLILAEGKAPLDAPEVTVRINDQPAVLTPSESADGWTASGLQNSLAWSWRTAPLPGGTVEVELRARAWQATELSAWVAARQDFQENANGEAPLPAPEFRYLDAVVAVPPTHLNFTRPAGEVNLALLSNGARASCSSVYAPEHTAERAIDGDSVTRWNSNWGDVSGAWLQIDFPAPCELHEMRFNEAAGGRITEYAFQAWDGHAWTTVAGAHKSSSRTRVQHRFEPVRSQRVRLLIVTATQLPSIYELEVIGKNLQPATASAPTTTRAP